MSVQQISMVTKGDKESAADTFSELYDMLDAMVEDLADGNIAISIEAVEDDTNS